jgi:hypothetical protein
MTYMEMLTDAGLHLFFFGFGLLAGMFIFWIETRTGKNQ